MQKKEQKKVAKYFVLGKIITTAAANMKHTKPVTDPNNGRSFERRVLKDISDAMGGK
jgi:hypothetical protein